MSRLTELVKGEGNYIDPDEVSEIKVNPSSGTLTVRMKNGIGYSVGADYGSGIYATAERLAREINSGRTGGEP